MMWLMYIAFLLMCIYYAVIDPLWPKSGDPLMREYEWYVFWMTLGVLKYAQRHVDKLAVMLDVNLDSEISEDA